MAEAPKFTPATNGGILEPKGLKVEEVTIPSTDQEAIEIVKRNSSAIQFKNSLVYIQGGTNVSLDRMIARFDVVLAQVLMEGVQLGLAFAKSQLK